MTKTFIGLLIGFSSLITMDNLELLSIDNANELDQIDAYNLKIEGGTLFGNIKPQANLLGLPNQVLKDNQPVEFKTIEDVFKLIQESIDYSTVSYDGIEFWCFNDLESIPCKLDFRKLEKEVSNGSLKYCSDYKLSDFKNDYPNSFANSPAMPTSFFSMATQEKTVRLKHYFVERSTKSDPNVKLLVEFTFQKEKLIYMFFANF